MRCPICDSSSRQIFKKHNYWICECNACRHRYVPLTNGVEHLERVYGDHYFTEGGAGYSDYLGEADLIIAHSQQYGRLLSRYMTPGKVLDVGAAAGFILKGLSAFGWRGVGLEPNTAMANYGRTQLGLEIQVGSLEHFKTGEHFDLVTMIQVLPHFYSLRQALQTAAELTQPGGYWLIETWNRDSFMAQLMGQNWHEYSPPSVLHFFSPATLALLMGQFGFTEVARGRPAKKLNSAHAKSLLQYKLKNSILEKPAARLFNLIPANLPIPYPSFDLFWALYQKSSSNG